MSVGVRQRQALALTLLLFCSVTLGSPPNKATRKVPAPPPGVVWVSGGLNELRCTRAEP